MNTNPQTVEDLLVQEDFLAWYFKWNEQKQENWNQRIARDPALKKLSEEASQFLVNAVLSEKGLEPNQLSLANNRFNQNVSLQAIRGGAPAPVVPIKRAFRYWKAVAAIFLIGLSSFGAWFYYNNAPNPSVKTQFGEIKDAVLPDGSLVTLNANSSIRFAHKWKKGAIRECWLIGEAFFQVQKTAEKSQFIVHTSKFDVFVTGTKFNVVDRTDKANVLLKEGSVLIKSGAAEGIVMKPGEFLEFQGHQFEKKQSKGLQLMAWKDRKFIFEKTPMKAVAVSITELYGLPVKFGDEKAAGDSISGIMANDNLDTFIQLLETAQNYEIVNNNHEILIRSKH
jgi:transmembrane sensor